MNPAMTARTGSERREPSRATDSSGQLSIPHKAIVCQKLEQTPNARVARFKTRSECLASFEADADTRASNASHGPPLKKVKKSKWGLHDDWTERTRLETDQVQVDDPWQMGGFERPRTIVGHGSTDRSRTASSPFTGSSRPITQSNSEVEDDREGGITDDGREQEEPGNLSGKVVHPEILKRHYYGGGSKTVKTEVSVVVNVEIAAHVSSLDPLSCPRCSHHISSHIHKANHEFPRRCCPLAAQERRYPSRRSPYPHPEPLHRQVHAPSLRTFWDSFCLGATFGYCPSETVDGRVPQRTKPRF